MDFMAAPEERFLNAALPEDRYPGRHSVWEFLSGDEMAENNTTDLPYLNFFMATGGRGTIEFVELAAR